MKDKDLFQKIEQFDDYPIDYQSNLSTQQKLIEDSVNSSNSNIHNAHTYKSISIVATIVAVLVSIAVYFSVNPIKKESKHLVEVQPTKSKAMIEQAILNAQYNPSIRASNFNVTNVPDINMLNIDTIKTIVYQLPVLAVQSDTTVPQKEIALKEQPKLFAKKQRFKQFDFEANVISSPFKNSKRKLEFFVLKGGQFKIISRNKNQTNVIQFE